MCRFSGKGQKIDFIDLKNQNKIFINFLKIHQPSPPPPQGENPRFDPGLNIVQFEIELKLEIKKTGSENHLSTYILRNPN